MMAFFLLLWLLNATTEEQKAGISDYFAPSSVSRNSSGAGGILGGKIIAIDGSRPSQGSIMAVPLPASPTELRETELRDGESPGDGGDDEASDAKKTLNRDEENKLLAKLEQERFDEAANELRQAIQTMPELARLGKA